MTREEAREFLLSIANKLGYIGVEDLTDRDGKRMIEAIKALEEPPKTGKWLINETSFADGVRQTCTCSICGRRSVRPLGDFCRWCGADVRGNADGSH